MPAKGKPKKPKKLKPYEKCQEFMEGYTRLTEQYDVPAIDVVGEIYNELIAKGKSCRKLPQMLQFADMKITGIQLRPLIDALQMYDVKPKFLSFMNTESGDDGIHMLANALIPPLEINGIAFINENITPSGCRGFARGMVQSESLSVLELDYNSGIGDDGILSLTHYGHCPTLLRLSLKYCRIADKGAEALGKWLAMDSCKIQELELNGNDIGPAGISIFGFHLPRNQSLQKIDLSNNMFGGDADALNSLREGIAGCKTLVSVLITNNFECPDGVAEKLLDLVQDKPLSDFEFTCKMDPIVFQNTRAIAMTNKKKLAKESKKKKSQKSNEEEEEEDKIESGDKKGNSEEPPPEEAAETS